MKKLLRIIRSFIPLNFIVRVIIKFNYKVASFIYKGATNHWVLSGTVKINLPDKNSFHIFSKGDDFIPNQLYWKGFNGYEKSIDIFWYFAKSSKIVVDIGANIGLFSIVAAKANINAMVYSFEPVERIYNRLLKQIKLNKIENIYPECCAVGDTSGTISLFIPEGKSMALASSAKEGWLEGSKEFKIKSYTLDDYKTEKKITKIDLIKIDVELYEYEIFMGMKKILETDKPIIFCEILLPESEGVKGHFNADSYLKVNKLLNDYNYSIYLIHEGALIKINEFEFNPIERNYIFLPFALPKVFNPICV